MDYKKQIKLFTVLILTGFIIGGGCSKKEKSNTDNTFYIELVNFTNDSLKKNISERIFGKVSFYKKNKLEIVSLNYVTEDYSGMHYFQSAEGLGKDIKPGTKKIKIEFKGNFSLDSIKYSLQKYRYKNKQWFKTSDMGEIKDTKNFIQPVNIINEFVRLIILNTVQYSYD